MNDGDDNNMINVNNNDVCYSEVGFKSAIYLHSGQISNSKISVTQLAVTKCEVTNYSLPHSQ